MTLLPRRAAKAGSSRGRGGGRSSDCGGGFDCCGKAAAGILVSSYEGGRSGSAVSGPRLMSVMTDGGMFKHVGAQMRWLVSVSRLYRMYMYI